MQARGFENPEYAIVPNNEVITVGNYIIKADSVCIQWNPASVNGVHFAVIELTAGGSKPGALPTVSTYDESLNRLGTDSLLPPAQRNEVSKARSTFDALLYADYHAAKTGTRPRSIAVSSVVNQAAALATV
jgi:hypothetical protein